MSTVPLRQFPLDERKRAYLNSEGADKPLRGPLPDETLDAARHFRLSRVRQLLHQNDLSAILLYDPFNIRYAFDCSNMQVWTAHNTLRYALIFADGPGIMFEFKACEHLSEGLPGLDEVRVAKDEWPIVLPHPDFANNHGGMFEQGMVICVESLTAEEGSESIKLETQVLVTEQGVKRLDSFPWEHP